MGRYGGRGGQNLPKIGDVVYGWPLCGLSLKRKPVKEKKGIGNPSNVWNFRLLKTMRILEQVQLFFTSFEF